MSLDNQFDDFLIQLLQIESFEAPLDVSGLRNPEQAFNGIFIRAPVSQTVHVRAGRVLRGF